MAKITLDIPKRIIDELDDHVSCQMDYDNRSHLIRLILRDWLNENRDDLEAALEELEEEVDDD